MGYELFGSGNESCWRNLLAYCRMLVDQLYWKKDSLEVELVGNDMVMYLLSRLIEAIKHFAPLSLHPQHAMS